MMFQTVSIGGGDGHVGAALLQVVQISIMIFFFFSYFSDTATFNHTFISAATFISH